MLTLDRFNVNKHDFIDRSKSAVSHRFGKHTYSGTNPAWWVRNSTFLHAFFFTLNLLKNSGFNPYSSQKLVKLLTRTNSETQRTSRHQLIDSSRPTMSVTDLLPNYLDLRKITPCMMGSEPSQTRS